MQQPSIEELEREWEEACDHLLDPIVYYQGQDTWNGAIQRMTTARSALLAARQRQAEKDEEREAVEAMMRERIGSSGYSRSCLMTEGVAREALSALKAAGFSLTRSPPSPAPSPSPPAQTQQERAGSAEDYLPKYLRFLLVEADEDFPGNFKLITSDGLHVVAQNMSRDEAIALANLTLSRRAEGQR